VEVTLRKEGDAWIVAVFDRALTAREMARLASIGRNATLAFPDAR
jgi:hypothetical protein